MITTLSADEISKAERRPAPKEAVSKIDERAFAAFLGTRDEPFQESINHSDGRSDLRRSREPSSAGCVGAVSARLIGKEGASRSKHWSVKIRHVRA
jgi:hypothetical protein